MQLHIACSMFVFVALALVGSCRGEGYYHVDECSVSCLDFSISIPCMRTRMFHIQNKTACVYSYSSEQESEEGGLNFNTSFATTFTVTCESGNA